ncbi:MAG: signal recognition particle protein [Alphaproteobacteria bacterium]
MFDSLTNRLGDIFERLGKRGALSESDVGAALREVRVALLEADVALPVVKDLMASVKERAAGREVVRSVTPAQMVVKIVHDALIAMLGGEAAPLILAAEPPVAILMVGLQGSGKTTTTAKLGARLQARDKKKVLVASTDVRRPAAQEQLAVLSRQAGIAALPVTPSQSPLEITRRAMETGRLEGFDVVLLDTAGRLHIDDELMDEAAQLSAAAGPVETLLVADAMTGQDAVNIASRFNERLDLTGIVLTRVDGDARGGAALSMRAVTGCPIKFIGVGERLDALEVFHPDRIAGRILGMGDVVGLVERAAETVDRAEAEKLARKMEKGGFDLDDYASQLAQLGKIGGLSGLLGALPGVGPIQRQLKGANIDDSVIVRQRAIISSMTPSERRNVKILNASRRRRIAAGSGTSVQEVNRLLKQHREMSRMMKRMGKMGEKGLMRQMPPGLMPRL